MCGNAFFSAVGSRRPRVARLASAALLAVVLLALVGAAPALADFTQQEGSAPAVTLGADLDPNVYPAACPGISENATITWGDGTSERVTIPPTCFVTFCDPLTSLCFYQESYTVTASHDYREAKSYTYGYTSDFGGNSGKASITEAPITETDGVTQTAVEANSSRLALGTIRDANASADLGSDYQVSIDWGDGSPPDTTSGRVSGSDPSSFVVTGSHAYAEQSGTGYHVRATVQDGSISTTVSDIVIVTPLLPVAVTAPATSITPTSAVLNATVDPKRGATARFEYSTSPSLAGATVTALQVVPTGLGAQPVSATVTGLSRLTTYYYRVDAIDSIGRLVSGAIASFRTPAPLRRINSTMTWTFLTFKGYVVVKALMVHQVPADAYVDVSCAGHGCPAAFSAALDVAAAHSARCTHNHRGCRKRHRHGVGAFRNVNLTSRFRGHHLAFGDQLTVRIVGPGYIGKIYVFKVRSGINPTIGCLAPGSNVPGKGC
jgi:hypothetical protein